MTARERDPFLAFAPHSHTRLRRREKKSLIRRSFVSWKEQKRFFAIRARYSGLDAVNILRKPISNTISLCLMHRTAHPSRLACLAFNWWLYLAHSFYCQLNNWIKAKNSDWLCSSLFLTVAAGHTSFQRVHVGFLHWSHTGMMMIIVRERLESKCTQKGGKEIMATARDFVEQTNLLSHVLLSDSINHS